MAPRPRSARYFTGIREEAHGGESAPRESPASGYPRSALASHHLPRNQDQIRLKGNEQENDPRRKKRKALFEAVRAAYQQSLTKQAIACSVGIYSQYGSPPS